jgi:Na+/H+ antiporter NhaD/arsenite permease-like protein
VWPTVLVFAATYALVAGRRVRLVPVGRPTFALMGACAMVVLYGIDPRSGLSPDAAFRAVEPNTIGLLLGMMLLSAALGDAGFFERASSWVLARRPSPVVLLWATTLGAGALAAVLVNDPVCLLLAPLVDRTARRAGLDRVPYLLALAMGANAGSAMTLAGNPQNMLIAHLSGLSYRAYLVRGGPAGLLALVATAATLHLMFRRKLDGRAHRAVGVPIEPPEDHGHARDRLVAISVLAMVALAFLAGANLAWTALTGAGAALVLRRRDASPLIERVGWNVLVFFAGLFIVTVALQRTGLPDEALRATSRYLPDSVVGAMLWLSGVLVVGCQIVSNVPFILLAAPWIRSFHDPALAWVTTAVVSTVVGNLTLLGSVANVIVVETAHAEQEIGFYRYLRVGAPVTLAGSVAALAWLVLSAPLFR